MANQITVDVAQELSEAHLGRLHKWLGVMIASLTLFDGYDTFSPTYVIHFVAGPWGLSASQAGLLVSSGLVGFLVGAAGHGMVADRIGRRVTLLAGLWTASIFTAATPLLAHSMGPFCVLRVFTGIGLGVLLPLATTYINELAPRRVVNLFSLWGVAFGWALGGALAGLVGIVLTPAQGWRVLYWIGSTSFLLTIVLHFHLPESVLYLAIKGRTEEIRALLTRLIPTRAAAYRQARFLLPAASTSHAGIRALLTPGLRRTTLTVWVAAFLSLFCIFGLTGWIPTVMMRRGETFAASFGLGALLQITSFLGGMVCARLADKHGNSPRFLATWWTVGGLAVLTLAPVNHPAMNFVSVSLAGFGIIGAQFVLNNFTASAYDTSVRATAVGMMLSVGRVGAVLGPFVAGALQQSFKTPVAMFLVIAGSAISAAIAVLSLGSAGTVAFAPPPRAAMAKR